MEDTQVILPFFREETEDADDTDDANDKDNTDETDNTDDTYDTDDTDHCMINFIQMIETFWGLAGWLGDWKYI